MSALYHAVHNAGTDLSAAMNVAASQECICSPREGYMPFVCPGTITAQQQ